jgi:hypothetical protein
MKIRVEADFRDPTVYKFMPDSVAKMLDELEVSTAIGNKYVMENPSINFGIYELGQALLNEFSYDLKKIEEVVTSPEFLVRKQKFPNNRGEVLSDTEFVNQVMHTVVWSFDADRINELENKMGKDFVNEVVYGESREDIDKRNDFINKVLGSFGDPERNKVLNIINDLPQDISDEDLITVLKEHEAPRNTAYVEELGMLEMLLESKFKNRYKLKNYLKREVYRAHPDIGFDPYSVDYTDTPEYLDFRSKSGGRGAMNIRVQADSYPKGYDIELPDYADNDGVDIITFFDMMQNYHSGQWDPVYAFTSRRRGDDLSLEELRAAKTVLEEIISGKFGEEALNVENENEGYSDMEVAESWLPTIARLISENEYRDEEEEKDASSVAGAEELE